MPMGQLILMMKYYPFKKPTEKQLKYAKYLQTFVQDDKDLTEMNKEEVINYIDSIKNEAKDVISELMSHTDVVW